MSDASWGAVTQPSAADPEAPPAQWLPHAQLQRLLDVLRARATACSVPWCATGVLRFDEVKADRRSCRRGWRDEQGPGRYRLEQTRRPRPRLRRRERSRARSSARLRAARAAAADRDGRRRPGRAFRAEPILPEPTPLALLGVRACDLAGLAVQDRIFLQRSLPRSALRARRARLLLVAVGCTRSVVDLLLRVDGDGPEPPARHFDLALTEMDDGFVVRAGSDAGARSAGGARARRSAGAAALGATSARPTPPARPGCSAALDTRDVPRPALREPRASALGRRRRALPLLRQLHDGLPHLLLPRRARRARPRRRRLACACASGTRASTASTRRSTGSNFRPHIRERYRQWLVHKLASWIDQFGTSGCVGCGRCITWCPVGIDLTEEVAAIAGRTRARDRAAVRLADASRSRRRSSRSTPSAPTSTPTGCASSSRARAPRFDFVPGQFNMVYVPGVGEVAISISSDPDDDELRAHDPHRRPHDARDRGAGGRATCSGCAVPTAAAGRSTRRAVKDVLVVTGGLGCAPVTGAIEYMFRRRANYGHVTILHGVKKPADLVHRDALRSLAPRARHHGAAHRRPARPRAGATAAAS